MQQEGTLLGSAESAVISYSRGPEEVPLLLLLPVTHRLGEML